MERIWRYNTTRILDISDTKLSFLSPKITWKCINSYCAPQFIRGKIRRIDAHSLPVICCSVNDGQGASLSLNSCGKSSADEDTIPNVTVSCENCGGGSGMAVASSLLSKVKAFLRILCIVRRLHSKLFCPSNYIFQQFSSSELSLSNSWHRP